MMVPEDFEAVEAAYRRWGVSEAALRRFRARLAREDPVRPPPRELLTALLEKMMRVSEALALVEERLAGFSAAREREGGGAGGKDGAPGKDRDGGGGRGGGSTVQLTLDSLDRVIAREERSRPPA